MTMVKEPLKLCHHSTIFGSHRLSGSRDIMISVCHVTLQGHVIRALCDFMVSEPFKISHHPTKFHGHRHCGSGDKWFQFVT